MTRSRRALVVFCSIVVSTQPTLSQTAVPAPGGQVLLQKSLAAMLGNTPLSDITLSGNARSIAGADDEMGGATVKLTSKGQCRIDLNLPSGTRTETRTTTPDGPFGAWSGSDGVSHPVAFHNLQNDCAYIPALTTASLLSSSNIVITYIGQENRDGQPVLHLQSFKQFSSRSATTTKLLQHLTVMDIFLDASSLVPVAVDFNVHPDDDADLDIPIELRYFDYRVVSGVQVPFRVQKYLNNGLILDLQFVSVSINSGISPSTFAVQAGI